MVHLHFIKNDVIKTYGAVEEELYTFLISALDGYIVSFTLRPLNPCTHWI
jgi:hypothetical protein